MAEGHPRSIMIILQGETMYVYTHPSDIDTNYRRVCEQAVDRRFAPNHRTRSVSKDISRYLKYVILVCFQMAEWFGGLNALKYNREWLEKVSCRGEYAMSEPRGCGALQVGIYNTMRLSLTL